MHKGRSVPAAAAAPSPPEPPAHEQPSLEAGIFHSIPRHSDTLQCPGTLAAVPVSAADTQRQRCVAWPARSHRASLVEANGSGKSRPEEAAAGAKGVPAPLRGPAAWVTTLQRGPQGAKLGRGRWVRGRVSHHYRPMEFGSDIRYQQHPPAATLGQERGLQGAPVSHGKGSPRVPPQGLAPCPTARARPPAPKGPGGARCSSPPCTPGHGAALQGPGDKHKHVLPEPLGQLWGEGPHQAPTRTRAPHTTLARGEGRPGHGDGQLQGPWDGPGSTAAPALLSGSGKGRAWPNAPGLRCPTEQTT